MQTVIIYILVAVAVTYIGRRAYMMLTRKGSAGCEHCSQDMHVNKSAKATPGK